MPRTPPSGSSADSYISIFPDFLRRRSSPELFISWKQLHVQDPTDLSITVSRLSADFVEGDGTSGVTWNTQPGVEAFPTDTAIMDALAGDWFEMDLTAVTTAEWQSSDPTNVLIRISPTAETPDLDKYFGYRTKEFETGSNRAQLVVDYVIPTATPTNTPTPTVTPTPTATPTITGPPLPTPTPEEVTPANDLTAPTLDLTVPTTVDMAAEFLYTGANPVQTGVIPGTIETNRAAILRGRVLDKSGQPLSGVEISILNAPELGSTLTRTNGMFDMAVNGGGVLTVKYEKTDLIPVQRQADVPWQDYVWLPDVVMIAYDPTAMSVNLNGVAGTYAAHDGSVESDADGMRRPRLLFPLDTSATILFDDGSPPQVVQTMVAHVTEFTVGPNGPAAMPADLPPTSAYTYAAEFSIEEEGAAMVIFEEPVIFYLENFLPSEGPEPGLPVGLRVPTGYYDRAAGIWVPSEDGRIVKITGFDANNRANLDTDGDNVFDNDPTLGITDEERAHLDPARYSAGQTLWRVPISHFTPYDCNFPYVPPEDAIEPTEEPENPQPETCVDTQPGSRIECQNQILGESVPITGTPFRLQYGSDRVPGRRSAYTIQIPLTGSSVPGNLNRVELEVAVAGRLYEMTVDTPTPNLSTSFTWDGTDGYDRLLQGTQSALIHVGYVYDGVYAEPDTFEQSFARFSGVPLLLNRTRREITLQRSWRRPIGAWDARAVGLGGWTLNVHHTYEPTSGVVHFGDGTQLRTQLRDQVIDTVAGSEEVGVAGENNGDNGPAVLAKLNDPRGVAVAPDGTFYTADTGDLVIRRVSPDGVITTVAGNGDFGVPTPGMPATDQAFRTLLGVGVGPDGSVYFCDDGNNRVYRVAADGILEVVAGNGSFFLSGDGGPATAAGVPSPIDVAIASDGSVYIADWGQARVRRVAPDGIITTVAGNGSQMATGDGGPATDAGIGQPEGIALGPDGSVYIADTINDVVRRVGPDGIISTVAGTGQSGFSPGGMPATDTLLNVPTRVAVIETERFSLRTARIVSSVAWRRAALQRLLRVKEDRGSMVMEVPPQQPSSDS